ncbi:5-carboxymethyl-2-hydroxymuconate Delta-isomerase [Aestuariibacter sp. A3R04]|uniref:5-carboxymethyl-2-hydroxymuconate Delta-isomerase n=1 Tax=Aestuariibacter sp. A3R04 TaxID=2841571 RepID=UPI001C083F25|nr:5-carboxymethyl-2-hydroxymuconate Delta-isomerase [Aestuariibacter sp. A3R04]MBU3023934.1 5-carboxymethyl-2-hydroxymuconate Delta-isomerase [Aestuariibacter sp. A3R04]
MPHCVIEYSSDISPESLMSSVFKGAIASDLFDKSGTDVKVRAIAYDHHISGASLGSFIHVSLKILSGRSKEQKESLSNSVLQKIKENEYVNCSITVEVIDIDRSSYAKSLV